MRSLLSISKLFRNKFGKFNNTGAWMLVCIYHRTLNYLKFACSAWKHQYIATLTRHYNGRHYITLHC